MHVGRLRSIPRLTAVLVLAFLLTALVCIPVYVLILLKLLLPSWRTRIAEEIVHFCSQWVLGVVWLQRQFLPTRWEIEYEGEFSPELPCLVVANHQSWVDIPVLLVVLFRRVPFPRFFLKRQLLLLPLLGPVWWGLDYPALRRHSREYLARHPERAGDDLRTVRRMCRRYRGVPASIINFAEGTRFSATKHARQESPYRHLLRPRAGGAAFALSAMEGSVTRLVDLTIAYPAGKPAFLSYLAGELPLVRVRARSLEIPRELLQGDYLQDEEYRARFQDYLRGLWEEKDRALNEMLEERAPQPL
ncbi:MAG TPA: acetyltransferase [Candidatus Krumholzibacteria bacterium]|nr:acetyltransferase [Candidatus Krumholzibacteria bacterium]